jgi:hypothetical protein
MPLHPSATKQRLPTNEPNVTQTDRETERERDREKEQFRKGGVLIDNKAEQWLSPVSHTLPPPPHRRGGEGEREELPPLRTERGLLGGGPVAARLDAQVLQRGVSGGGEGQ